MPNVTVVLSLMIVLSGLSAFLNIYSQKSGNKLFLYTSYSA
jgi:hypothetical protein